MNTAPLFLDSDEIRELTHRHRRSAQVEALRTIGIEHRTRPDGTLIVLRAHVEQLLGANPAAISAPDWEPDWSPA